MAGREVREQVGRGARARRRAVDGGLVVHARNARAAAVLGRRGDTGSQTAALLEGRDAGASARTQHVGAAIVRHKTRDRLPSAARSGTASPASASRPASPRSATFISSIDASGRCFFFFGGASTGASGTPASTIASSSLCSGGAGSGGIVAALSGDDASGGLATSAGSASAFGGGGATSMSTVSTVCSLTDRSSATTR